jgi:hypothetical protein
MEIRENRFFTLEDKHKVQVGGDNNYPEQTIDVSFTLMIPYGVTWELCHQAATNFAQTLKTLQQNALNADKKPDVVQPEVINDNQPQ